jgi:hypothetical protein
MSSSSKMNQKQQKQKAERTIKQLQRQVNDGVQWRVSNEENLESKKRELEELERTGSKARRQLEWDKDKLAEEVVVSRNEANRLAKRAIELRSQRLNLKKFRTQGLKNITKAVAEQRQAVIVQTQVFSRLLFLCFFV